MSPRTDSSADRLWRAATAAFVVAFGAGCGAAIVWTGFHVSRNDFWGNVALAQQGRPTSLASWYNPFYPFGYALLLRSFEPSPIVPAHLLNIASGVVLIATVGRIATRLAGPAWGLGACVVMSMHPQIFQYVTTPGPDIAVAALVALAFDRLLASSDPVDPAASHRRLWPAGVLLGAAALLRYHALVLGVLVIAAAALGWPAVRRRTVPALAALAAVYALQMTVTMAAHHGPFHTGQALVFQKLVHPVNWFHIDDASAPATAREVIAAAPAAFVSAYLRQLTPLALLLAPSGLLILVATVPAVRRLGLVALMILVPYIVIVAAGGSSRADLPVLFLMATSAAAAAQALGSRLSARSLPLVRPVGLAGALLVGLVWGLPWLRADYGTVKYRRQDDQIFRRVESTLRLDGVVSAKEVFASDLTLYFPTLPGYTPRTNGTWLRYDGAAYNARFPELCVESVACFLQDARASGVTHLVLTSAVHDLSPEVEPLYGAQDSHPITLLGQEGSFRIFRLE